MRLYFGSASTGAREITIAEAILQPKISRSRLDRAVLVAAALTLLISYRARFTLATVKQHLLANSKGTFESRFEVSEISGIQSWSLKVGGRKCFRILATFPMSRRVLFIVPYPINLFALFVIVR